MDNFEAFMHEMFPSDEDKKEQLDKASQGMFEIYSSLVKAGFTRDQAFELLLHQLDNAVHL